MNEKRAKPYEKSFLSKPRIKLLRLPTEMKSADKTDEIWMTSQKN